MTIHDYHLVFSFVLEFYLCNTHFLYLFTNVLNSMQFLLKLIFLQDWLDFEAASEEDTVHEFLKLTPPAPDQRLNRVDSMTERQASVTSNEGPPVAENDPKPETATENNHEVNNDDTAPELQSDRKSSVAHENSNASSKKSSRAPSEEKANSSSKKSSRAPSEEKANSSSKKSSRAASEEKEKSKSPSKKSSRAASEEKSKSNQSSRKSSRAASETKEKENDEPSLQRETTPSGDEPLTSNETDE